jgi:hypothetical protein
MTTNSALRNQLKLICQNFQIESGNVFTLGSSRYVLPCQDEKNEIKLQNRNTKTFVDLIELVTSQLYEQCYVRPFYVAEKICEESALTPIGEDNLTPLFHAANDNKDGWDPGWKIYKTGFDGRLFVQKGDRSRAVMAGEYSTYKWPGASPVAGDFVSVRMFAGSTDVQPSFFYAFGRTLSDQFDEYAIVRFYFNVTAQQSPFLMAQLTESLNHYQIPFKYKALVQAKMYTRTDSAVLYVARRYYQIVASVIIDLQRDERISLREEIPLFSHSLINGVGMAEDHKAGTSFGMYRCDLMAHGLVDAWLGGAQDVGAQMKAIEAVFTVNQINLDRPYLNPFSSDIFNALLFDKETRW